MIAWSSAMHHPDRRARRSRGSSAGAAAEVAPAVDSRAVITVPAPGRESTSSVPPAAATRSDRPAQPAAPAGPGTGHGRSVVGDPDLGRADRDGAQARLRVPDDIGHRFPDDVPEQLADLVGQRLAARSAPGPRRRPRAAPNARWPARSRAGPGQSRGGGADVGQGLPGDRLDLGDLVAGRRRVGIHQPGGQPGLDRDRRQRVAEDVVQVAPDPLSLGRQRQGRDPLLGSAPAGR